MTEMMDDIVKTSRATRQRCYSATEFPMSAPRVSRHERFNSEMPWIWDEVPGQGVDDDVQYEESGVSVKGRSQCEESINPALGFEDDIHRHLLQGDVAVSAEWVDDTVRTLRTASRQRCYSTPDNSLAAPRLSRHERFNSEMPWIWDEIPGQGDDNASSPTTVPEEAFQDADSSDEHHPLFKIQAASPPLGQQDQNHSNTSTPSLSISGLQNPPLAKPLDHSFKCNKTYMEPRTAAYIDFVDIPIPSPSQKTPFPVKDVSTVETVSRDLPQSLRKRPSLIPNPSIELDC
ncbi:hypothetical protein BC829DRAFT_251431 [Chytridium lagenaria]|nr:hypothetical protein BC829DRAFT_251431 [Chytridium lagenaria]